MADSMREEYERIKNGEQNGELDKEAARTAMALLRFQAACIFAKENSIEIISITSRENDPWKMSIRFSDDNLSEYARGTLECMYDNAHRTEMKEDPKTETAQITFYVYTMIQQIKDAV